MVRISYRHPHPIDLVSSAKLDDGVVFEPYPSGSRYPAGYFEVVNIKTNERMQFRVVMQKDGRCFVTKLKRDAAEDADTAANGE